MATSTMVIEEDECSRSTLKQCWERVELLRGGNQEGDKGSRNSAYEKLCEAIDRCQEMTDRLGIFSRNEEADDIVTQSLKYLLLHFYKAEALQECEMRGDDPYRRRLIALREAKKEIEIFLNVNERTGILDETTTAVYMRDGPVDAATTRSEKIARHNRERELQKQLETIQERRMERRRKVMGKIVNSGSFFNSNDCDENVKDEEEEDDDYDDDERNLWMVKLRLAHDRAIDMISMLDLEIQMLEMRPPNDNLGETSGRNDRAISSKKREVYSIPEIEVSGTRFSLVDNRQRLAASVFKPSHNLPTKSLEEFAMEEIASTREREDREKQRVINERERREQMTEEEREDEDVFAARQRDDFNDVNPTGWGNSKLRPCG